MDNSVSLKQHINYSHNDMSSNNLSQFGVPKAALERDPVSGKMPGIALTGKVFKYLQQEEYQNNDLINVVLNA